MPITAQRLLQIIPNAGKQAGVLCLCAERWPWIGSRSLHDCAWLRSSMQVGQESGQFRYVKELGGDQYLSKYDTGPLDCSAWGIRLKKLTATVRSTAGVVSSQVTGRDNYLACSKALFRR